MSEVPVSQARDHLGEIVSRAEHAQERTVLTRHGKAVAAVISIDDLRKLDKPVARRVLTAVTRLGVDPRPPGTRALTGYPQGTMRLRVGDYRVVYLDAMRLALHRIRT